MSDKFIELLDYRDTLLLHINLVLILFFILMCMVSWKSKNLIIPIVINFILIDLAFRTTLALFDSWWLDLSLSASTEEDSIWIANHDGGGIVFVLSIFFKSGFLYLLSLFIRLSKKKKEEVKHTDKTDTLNR